jgi:hypothetical protein
MRVRRLAAGELAGDERARTEAHLAACARCQATAGALERERADLERLLPFETFAAGVAERLARGTERPARPRGRRLAFALAAGLAVVAALPVVLRLARDHGADYRMKGGAELAVYARDGEGVRALAPGEPVPRGAALRIGVLPDGRRFVAIALLDADGAAVLYAGPAEAGVLPGAFEWTGTGDGALVAVLDDAPVDAASLAETLSASGAAAASPIRELTVVLQEIADHLPGGRAEAVVVPLTRGTP